MELTEIDALQPAVGGGIGVTEDSTNHRELIYVPVMSSGSTLLSKIFGLIAGIFIIFTAPLTLSLFSQSLIPVTVMPKH